MTDDWRSIEDPELRKAAKEEAFRETYAGKAAGASSADRPSAGRMHVEGPPLTMPTRPTTRGEVD